jgi:hypothetical protein
MRICKPLNLDLAAAEKRCFELVSKAEAQFDDNAFPFPWPKGTPDVWSSEEAFKSLRIFISLGCREIVPHIGQHIVLRHTSAHVVPNSEVELGFRIPCLSASTLRTLCINPNRDDC